MSDEIDRIQADEVTLEVVDAASGKLFRRKVPLSYVENDNGILLGGEDSSGAPSQIAFLSSAAMDKLRDLTGKGPDAPRCDHEH